MSYAFPIACLLLGALDLTASSLARSARPAESLRVGTVAPNFRLQANHGNPIDLQSLRGKIVYLDFWFTGCQPCLAEAPAAARLKKRFLGRDVVFVYVSNETFLEGWKQNIEKYSLDSPNSVHLLDPDGVRAVRPYRVAGYPTYVLLDRAGRVLDANAPRPSDGERTVRELEKALAAH